VNNPAPIPGWHTPEGHCAQWCGYLDLAKLLTNSPCVMTTEVLEIHHLVQSPVKVGQTIGNKNQLRSLLRPGQSTRRHLENTWWKTRVWRQSLSRRLSPTNPLRVTHCSQTRRIHEGRSDYPMSPQNCLIRPSRLPMRLHPKAPDGDVSKCVREGTDWMDEGTLTIPPTLPLSDSL
jgi:hypothetical protein